MNYYEILGLEITATETEIKIKYQEMARKVLHNTAYKVTSG
jgi:curved DNA-binding protein CbpA